MTRCADAGGAYDGGGLTRRGEMPKTEGPFVVCGGFMTEDVKEIARFDTEDEAKALSEILTRAM